MLQAEGEGGSEERGVKHLPQNTCTEKDRRTLQMKGISRGFLPVQLTRSNGERGGRGGGRISKGITEIERVRRQANEPSSESMLPRI